MAAGSEMDDPTQRAARSTSSDLCGAGYHLSADCSMGQAIGCCLCPPGSFLSHPNREASCWPCTQCQEDQEMVSDCTPTRDRQCQCKPGEYYCASEPCPESCHRCTSCPGATLQTCNATRDTVCAPTAPAEPGPAARSLAVSTLVLSVVAFLIIAIAIIWWRRRAASVKPGSHALGSTQPGTNLPITDPERGPPDAETTRLLQEEADAPMPGAQTRPGPSADPDLCPGVELQVEVAGGGWVAPEPSPPTYAAAAPGAQTRPGPSADPDLCPGVELQVEVAGGGWEAPEPAPPAPAAAVPGDQAWAEPPTRLHPLEQKETMSWCQTSKCPAMGNPALAAALSRAQALSGPQDAMSVPLICDFGSGSSKVGFAGAQGPLAVFPTVLGKLRCDDDDLLVGLDKKVWFIGDEVQKQREKLNLVYPISRATVTNWDHLEKIWHHSFYQVLRVPPEQHPMLLTEPPSNSKASKERMAQVLFETFRVPALYIVNQGVLSLFSSGLTSGTAIESGEGMTHFVPILEGCPLHQSTMQMDVAGQDITLYLMQLLSRKGNSLLGTGDREYVRDLKEKCCYVALDFDKEKAAALAVCPVQKHQLPDGREIELGPEQFLCMEALFQPDLIGKNSLGAHMIALRSISSCRPDLQRPLFRNVLLSGGTGSSPSLRARMQRELSALVSPTTNVKVSTCPCSVYSAWVGGSVLCSLSTFKDMWVTSDDYYEKGPSAVSKRSF